MYETFLWKLLSFHTKMIFSLIPFGEVCFLEDSYENMQKNQVLKIVRAPSIQHQWVCLFFIHLSSRALGGGTSSLKLKQNNHWPCWQKYDLSDLRNTWLVQATYRIWRARTWENLPGYLLRKLKSCGITGKKHQAWGILRRGIPKSGNKTWPQMTL